MLPIKLFFSKSFGEYYLVENDVKCSRCGCFDFSKSVGYCFVLRNYFEGGVKFYVFCSKCYKLKLTDLNDGLFDFSSFVSAKILDDVSCLPFDSKLDKSNEFEFRDGKDLSCPNVRDVAVSNVGVRADCSNVKIVDNTKFAGRESFNGFLIGNSEKVALIDSKVEEFARRLE